MNSADFWNTHGHKLEKSTSFFLAPAARFHVRAPVKCFVQMEPKTTPDDTCRFDIKGAGSCNPVLVKSGRYPW